MWSKQADEVHWPWPLSGRLFCGVSEGFQVLTCSVVLEFGTDSGLTSRLWFRVVVRCDLSFRAMSKQICKRWVLKEDILWDSFFSCIIGVEWQLILSIFPRSCILSRNTSKRLERQFCLAFRCWIFCFRSSIIPNRSDRSHIAFACLPPLANEITVVWWYSIQLNWRLSKPTEAAT